MCRNGTKKVCVCKRKMREHNIDSNKQIQKKVGPLGGVGQKGGLVRFSPSDSRRWMLARITPAPSEHWRPPLLAAIRLSRRVGDSRRRHSFS